MGSREEHHVLTRPADSVVYQPGYRPLVTTVLALAAGLVLDRYVPLATFVRAPPELPVVFLLWWSLAAALLVAWWWLWRRQHERPAAPMLLLAVALTGAAWHDLRWNLFGRDEIARFGSLNPQPACVEAIALERPARLPAPRPTLLRAIPQGERSELSVRLVALRDGRQWRPVGGECRLFVSGHLLDVEAGDRLRIFAQLSRASPAMNPGEFDFAAAARAERQLASLGAMAPECVAVVERAAGGGWRRAIDRVRAAARQSIWRRVDGERAPVAEAMLIGRREAVRADTTARYFITGTVHLLVVSGLHLAVLASGLFAAMRWGLVPRRVALVTIILLVVAYAVVAGGRPPVVRATVLVVLVSLAATWGRRGIDFNSLAAAALIVLIINPCDLFRAGPQLSFLAVAVLMWFGGWVLDRRAMPEDPLDRLIAASRPWPWRAMRGLVVANLWLLAATGCVWLTALPLVMGQFHIVSMTAVLVSPTIWPLVSGALLGGFGMLMSDWLMPAVAAPFGAVCNLSLACLEWIVTWAAAVPGGHFWVAGPATWWVVGFYLGLVALLLWGAERVAWRWRAALLSAWIVVGLARPLTELAGERDFRCLFLSMGHGICVLIESPTGETLLYDAGSIAAPHQAARTVSEVLWHRAITRVDGMVLSHADVDHYNAVPGLLTRLAIDNFYVSPVMFDGFGPAEFGEAPLVLRDAIRRAGVPIHEIYSGDRLRLGRDVVLRVLHPPRRGVFGSDNANSIVLAVEIEGRRILLTGDLESPGLEDVMAEMPLDCDVLLAPHHGSRRSDPPGFAAWSQPEYVVISGGRGTAIETVVETYRAAGAHVLRTDEQGAIEIRISNGDMQVTTWR